MTPPDYPPRKAPPLTPNTVEVRRNALHAGHTAVPADRCYWAILDPTVLPKRIRKDHDQLSYLFEAYLPVDLESVQCAFATQADGKVIACAVALDEVRAARDAGVITLTPDAIHPSVASDNPLDPAHLNLLTGPYEPPRFQQNRRIAFSLVAASLILSTALICRGLIASASALDAQAHEVEGKVGQIAAQALEVSPSRFASGSAAQAALLSRVRLIDAESGESPDSQMKDAVPTLLEVLANWPSTAMIQVETLRIGAASVVIEGSAPDRDQVIELHRALMVCEGWAPSEPSVQVDQRSDHRFSIRLGVKPTPQNTTERASR